VSTEPAQSDFIQDMESSRQRLSETTLSIYAAITLLGVLAAASWKGYFVDESELVVIIVATSVTLAVAHLWAAVAAYRLVNRAALPLTEWRLEARNSLAVLAVGGLAVATFLISSWWGEDFAGAVAFTLLTLVGVLFVVGLVGGRREGRSWMRSLALGLLDSSIGIVILLAKVTLGA
jgi:hypothetical protein